MKIKGTCRRDGRDFLIEQVIAAGGECPWDGQPFNADYAANLVESLRDAEEAKQRLERALEQIADLGGDFTLDQASILEGIQASLARINANRVTSG